MISTLIDMVEESRKLTAAAAAGELMQRGDADRFQGAYKDIVAGINQTLETITVPLQQAQYLTDNVRQFKL
jgi:methyl-accepting chemotaxis protein